MFRLFAGLFALALLTAGTTAAEDKKADDKDALTGKWVREAGGLDLTIEFTGKDAVKMSVFGGENGAIITAKYEVKDGLVKAKVTEVVEKGSFPGKPAKGLAFSFRWKVKNETATLDDLKGEGLEDAKAIVEGDYTKKK